jgi:hypothetical protein
MQFFSTQFNKLPFTVQYVNVAEYLGVSLTPIQSISCHPFDKVAK